MVIESTKQEAFTNKYFSGGNAHEKGIVSQRRLGWA